MSLSAHFNICFSCELAFVIFLIWIMVPATYRPDNLWVPDILNFTLLDTEYF